MMPLSMVKDKPLARRMWRKAAKKVSPLLSLDEETEGTRLHVRGIGVHGWDGVVDSPGWFEDESRLKDLFLPYGEVLSVAVRHRIQDGANTSWALVTMANNASAELVLGGTVRAGETVLTINPFNKKAAAKSTGMMAAVVKVATMAQTRSRVKASMPCAPSALGNRLDIQKTYESLFSDKDEDAVEGESTVPGSRLPHHPTYPCLAHRGGHLTAACVLAQARRGGTIWRWTRATPRTPRVCCGERCGRPRTRTAGRTGPSSSSPTTRTAAESSSWTSSST
jgi:hypothetical protein